MILSHEEIKELEKEIKTLSDVKKEKIDKYRQLVTELNLTMDNNVSKRLLELDLAYSKKDLVKFKSVYETLGKYLGNLQKVKNYELADIEKELFENKNEKAINFPESFGMKEDVYFNNKRFIEHTSVNGGLIALIGGNAGSGKTRLMCNLLLDYSVFGNFKAAVFTSEMTPKQLYHCMMSMYLYDTTVKKNNGGQGIHLSMKQMKYFFQEYGEGIKKDMLKENPSSITKAVLQMKKNISIHKMDVITPQEMFSSIQFMKIEKGLEYDVIFTDYLQNMKPSNYQKVNYQSEVSLYKSISDELRELTAESGTPHFLLSQLSQSEGRKILNEDVSDMNGFKYSGDIVNHAQIVGKIVREKDEETGKYKSDFELRIVKNRMGEVENVKLAQDGKTGRILRRLE